MKIAIYYIAIGKYDVFFSGFYKSCKKYFLPNSEKEYSVFTDSQDPIFFKNDKIHRIQQENMGWPDNTLQRFRLFNSVSEEVLKFDYAFFFNANLEFVKTINEDILPKQGIIAVKHFGYYNKPRAEYSYDTNPKSLACIDSDKGKVYVCGGVNGGTATDYIKMVRQLEKNTDIDTANGVVALWHDESHLNKYISGLSEEEYTVLDPGYCYPDFYYLKGIEMKIKLRSKELYIPVLTVKGEKSIFSAAKKYLYFFHKLTTSSILRKLKG